MIAGSLPFRYARALLSLAEKGDQLESVREELGGLMSLAQQSPQLIPFLSDARVAQDRRHQVLQDILDAAQTSDLMKRFCFVLLEKNRFAELENIVRAFDELCDERAQIVRAKVVSAAPLAADEAAHFERLLKEKTGKKVMVEYGEDPSLLGGVRVHLGSLVYDGSIRGDLERVREAMLK